MSIDLTNHIALTSSILVKEICKPLEKIGINYFSFVRSFADGSHIRLSNNPAWTKHYYDRKFYNVILKQVPDNEGNLLWANIDKYPLFYEASEYFDVDNGTVVILKIDDVTERYFFGSNRENRKVNDIYLYKFHLLQKFILYFKESAFPLIREAEKTKIIVPKDHNPINNAEDENSINDFLNEIKVNKIYVRIKGQDFYVSRSEAKILSLMKFGYTAKEISYRTSLKQKTIEVYCDKLKSKFSLHSKNNLISFATDNSLLNVKLL